MVPPAHAQLRCQLPSRGQGVQGRSRALLGNWATRLAESLVGPRELQCGGRGVELTPVPSAPGGACAASLGGRSTLGGSALLPAAPLSLGLPIRLPQCLTRSHWLPHPGSCRWTPPPPEVLATSLRPGAAAHQPLGGGLLVAILACAGRVPAGACARHLPRTLVLLGLGAGTGAAPTAAGEARLGSRSLCRGGGG